MNEKRSKTIVRSGILFVLTNFLLAGINLAVGLLSGSVAIISDSAHSAIDAISGFLVVIGEKVAKTSKFKAKREKIERITTVAIALVILTTGVHIVIESIEKIIEPEAADYSSLTILVLVISIGLKFALASYLKRQGKMHKSEVLLASGAETMNDMLISVAVLLAIVVQFGFGVNVEAYVSLLISILIFKIGLEFIFPHISHHHHHPLESDPDHDHCGK